MKKYVCAVCGYLYDEANGIPAAGIAPGTKWEDLPADWVCPLCGAAKSEFREQGAVTPGADSVAVIPATADQKELLPLEISAICSNLARGCEKQYMPEATALFTELSSYFKKAAAPPLAPAASKLLALVETDLSQGFPAANGVAAAVADRGAMRSLVWSEKVTRILNSLLTRYAQEGEAMLEHTGVYVCTICGFISVGDAPPALCPVCKVPSWKFEKMEGGVQ